ncbi:MAG: hypothetical protein L6R40_004121 [Gallowayella cf. fulva]|nr:MAG: hypothetical protein L6R40_004121 [Xanthomendoza cf. fulva]
MALDRVPGDAHLYIGGIFTLKRKEALKEANITHVLSVLTLPLDPALFEGYKHLAIDVDDDEDADLIQHFPASNAFIQEGLDGGGGVLIHCAMGKSRSATAIIAYLLSTSTSASPTHTPTTALSLLRQCRPICEPNPGFMDQLHLYHRMHCPTDIISHPLYQRWCWEREKKASAETGQVPGSEYIIFEDETPAAPREQQEKPEGNGGEGEQKGDVVEEYRCRRCRTSLGNSDFLIPHNPRPPPSKGHKPPPDTPRQGCAHLFLSPLSWMREALSEGDLEGRLECPNKKCRQNVGKFAWQGMKCSCGEWVVPGISVGRGRVDIVARRSSGGGRM